MEVLGGGAVSYKRGTPVVAVLAEVKVSLWSAVDIVNPCKLFPLRSEAGGAVLLRVLDGLLFFFFVTLKPRVE